MTSCKKLKADCKYYKSVWVAKRSIIGVERNKIGLDNITHKTAFVRKQYIWKNILKYVSIFTFVFRLQIHRNACAQRLNPFCVSAHGSTRWLLWHTQKGKRSYAGIARFLVSHQLVEVDFLKTNIILRDNLLSFLWSPPQTHHNPFSVIPTLHPTKLQHCPMDQCIT